MNNLSDLRLSKNMKYTALYVAMRFFEQSESVYEKYYHDGTLVKIYSNTQEVFINNKKAFELNTHESFVKLECINRLFILGYDWATIKQGLSENQHEIILDRFRIKCINWDNKFNIEGLENNEIEYKSRLISGVLEYKTKINSKGKIYDYGIFEQKNKFDLREKIVSEYNEPDFEIEENRIIRYKGQAKVVIVPDGITELESSAFWDNPFIEEVILPNTLINMGGDTFYNCKNLKHINIPSKVEVMGNNPFAGCPNIEIANHSNSFIYEEDALYTANKKTLIYCSIKGDKNEFIVPEGVEIICKHAFFKCDRLKKIILPTSLKKIENNPFSGCSQLEIINHSSAYFIKDNVIYNGFKTAVVGALNKITSDRLEILEGVKTINRNSFWNCKGIKLIVFPHTLEDIGYNPFVGCSNIHFESHSDSYKVIDGVLYNKDLSKIICYPAWKAIGEVSIPDSVITLERGAFSGCEQMTKINLHNVNIINKSCFTNCLSLKELYCSDLITYIGEWAFAYCKSLKKISVKKDTIIDNNATSNCPIEIEYRETNSNYLIESDNIFTLSAMQKAYKGKIDSILIDPPYNSNINYIGYKDGEYNEGYDAFMKKRIELSYTLLSSKGFLVINIDEGEVDNLKKICNNLFGENLVSVHKWKKLHPYFDVNRDVNPNKKEVLYEYIIICRKSQEANFNKIMQPYIANGQIKEYLSNLPEVFDCFGTTSSAKDEIKEIFGDRKYFSTPKPIKLMKELIRATTDKNSIIMDFFAGSATVGHACVELNYEDKGNRTYILVSNSESDIFNRVTKTRMLKLNTEFKILS